MNCIQSVSTSSRRNQYDIGRVVAVEAIDGGEHVELHAVFLEQPQAAHHLVECTLAALVHSIGVVERLRPIDADPDQDAMAKNSHHSSVRRVPLVCSVLRNDIPGCRYRSSNSMVLR